MLISRVWANRVTLQVLFRYSWLLTVMFYDKMILSKSYFHRVFLCGWKTKSLLENISKNLYTHSPFLKSGWKFWLSYEEKEVQLNSFVLRGEQFVVLVVCPICYCYLSYSLQPHGLQHASLPCPPLSPWVCSDSCPLNQWCHPTISSSAAPFSSCPPSLLESGSFPMSWLFPSWPKYWSFSFNISPPSEYSG